MGEKITKEYLEECVRIGAFSSGLAEKILEEGIEAIEPKPKPFTKDELIKRMAACLTSVCTRASLGYYCDASHRRYEANGNQLYQLTLEVQKRGLSND